MRKTLAILCLASLAAAAPLLGHAQDSKAGAGMRDPEKMRQAFEQRFKKADANGDGKLSKACLLYTSPSPRDGLLSRMPSSA